MHVTLSSFVSQVVGEGAVDIDCFYYTLGSQSSDCNKNTAAIDLFDGDFTGPKSLASLFPSRPPTRPSSPVHSIPDQYVLSAQHV